VRARDEELIRNLKGAGMLPDGEPRWPGFGQATYCKLPVKPELVKSRTGPAIHLERVVPIEWAPVGGRQTLWEFVKLVEAPPRRCSGSRAAAGPSSSAGTGSRGRLRRVARREGGGYPATCSRSSFTGDGRGEPAASSGRQRMRTAPR